MVLKINYKNFAAILERTSIKLLKKQTVPKFQTMEMFINKFACVRDCSENPSPRLLARRRLKRKARPASSEGARPNKSNNKKRFYKTSSAEQYHFTTNYFPTFTLIPSELLENSGAYIH